MNLTEPASVLISAGAVAVLRALSGTDSALSIRQVARVAGVSYHRAHQVIRRLAEHGLVLTEEQGPSLLCRLNREHLAAPAVIDLAQLRSKLVDLLRLEIAGWSPAPLHTSLFGSAARGDGDTSSDLDILVIRPAPPDEDDAAWGEQLLSSGRRIHAATGNHVTWLDITPADLHRIAQAGEPILDEWRGQAVLLTGADLRTLLRDTP